jgi:transketolase
MRTLPEMRVIVPADATSVYPAYVAALNHHGPVYIRLLRDPAPVLYDTEDQAAIELGRARVYADGKDVTLWACGIMVGFAVEARGMLEKDGISARVVDSASVKPLDADLLLQCVRETGCVVSCEDHMINGGLGSTIAELLGERYPAPMERIGLKDVFGESGEPKLLFEKYGMSPRHIAEAARRVIKRRDAPTEARQQFAGR